MAIAPLPDTAYWRAWQAPAKGLLRWDEVDALLEVLIASGGDWFVFDLGAPPPEAPVQDLAPVLEEVREMYAPLRSRSYCGTVYVDDAQAPRLVRFFDPYQMGASCGSSGERVWPRLALSRLRPDALPEPEPVPKPGFWGRLGGFAR